MNIETILVIAFIAIGTALFAIHEPRVPAGKRAMIDAHVATIISTYNRHHDSSLYTPAVVYVSDIGVARTMGGLIEVDRVVATGVPDAELRAVVEHELVHFIRSMRGGPEGHNSDSDPEFVAILKEIRSY